MKKYEVYIINNNKVRDYYKDIFATSTKNALLYAICEMTKIITNKYHILKRISDYDKDLYDTYAIIIPIDRSANKNKSHYQDSVYYALCEKDKPRFWVGCYGAWWKVSNQFEPHGTMIYANTPKEAGIIYLKYYLPRAYVGKNITEALEKGEVSHFRCPIIYINEVGISMEKQYWLVEFYEYKS